VSRKNLPKAIRQATDEAGEPSVDRVADEQTPARPPASSERSIAQTSARGSGHASATVAVVPAPPASPSPAAPALARAAPTGPEADPTRRRSLAIAIVDRHAAYAAVGGFIPVPIANVAAVTAAIVRMVKVLSGLYGVPFERDRARAIVIGLMGGTVPTGLAAVTTSTLVSLVPGSGLIGLGVASISAIACTRSIGRIFVEHFEGGATLQDLPAASEKT
jgi:uncharacterized protein (DUF697 family)